MSQTWDDTTARTPADNLVVERRRPMDFAPVPLRLILGIGFMVHGFPKLFSVAGHQGFVALLEGIQIPAPVFMAWSIGILEFFGGLMLVLGLLVSPIAFLAAIEMLAAAFTVHFDAGFNFQNGGMEVPLVYAAGFIALVLSGAGAWSVDRAVRRKGSEVQQPWVGMKQEPE